MKNLIFTIFLICILIISCKTNSLKNEKKIYYKQIYDYVLNDCKVKEIFVSDLVSFQYLSDFMKAKAIIVNENQLNKTEKEDRKNQFEDYIDEKIYSSINYRNPKNENLPILFFSKPKNDSIICEVFDEYQFSKNRKNYDLGRSKLYLFNINNNKITLLTSFSKLR